MTNTENSYTPTALPEHKNGGTEVAVIATVPALAANGCKKDKDATNGTWHAPGDAVTDPLNPVANGKTWQLR